MKEITRRSKLDQVLDMLDALARGDHKKTRLMYACNLSFNASNELLDMLVSSEIVEIIPVGKSLKRYDVHLTDKGKRLRSQMTEEPMASLIRSINSIS